MTRRKRKLVVKPWRHFALLIVIGACGIALSVRVVYLAVTERDFLQKEGDARSVRFETIPAMRGDITDRNGQPLAVSTPVYAVWTDPSKGTFTNDELKRVAAAIDESSVDLLERLSGDPSREFAYLKRRAGWEIKERIEALQIDNLYLQPEYRRYYPAAETAAHVVGMTDIDDRGQEGIERTYDETLSGKPGRKMVLKDRYGSTIRDLDHLATPIYGRDLKLSIDLNLQFIAYRELKSAVQGHGAASGSIVVVDVPSGDILALVNQPSYNPNDIKGYDESMRNRAVIDAFEPGSTVKPFTAIAALESGHYTHRTSIETAPGTFWIGRKMIDDPVNYGTLTLGQALQKSSQVAFSKIALQLDEEAVYDVLQRAGFGEFVGTGLPGESTGQLMADELRYPVVRAILAYGYGLSATPLQLAQAYSTVARMGLKMPVGLVRSDSPPRAERVFDERISREVLGMMEMVTATGGTAAQAAIPGFSVGGKTGTARLVGTRGYDDERHMAWFVGVVPVSKPRLVVVVSISEASGGATGGGKVASPVFHQVAKQSLRLLGVAPDRQIEVADRGTAGRRG